MTEANGCEYEEVLNLDVNPQTADEVEDVTICATELPYDWNGITITEAGTHTNPVTDVNGCEYTQVLNLEVNATSADETEDRVVCTADLPFTWNGQTITAAGTYTNSISDNNGCELSQILSVTVSALDVSGTTVEPTCNPSNGLQNGSITLNVTGDTNNVIYTWSEQNGSGLSISDMNQSNLGSGTYTVTAINEHCLLYTSPSPRD